MIEVRNVSRIAVEGWFRVARVPFDAAAQLLPRGRGSRNSALLLIDRADATARAAVGRLLRDDDLTEDAARRRIAADERVRAIQLRTVAEDAERAADARLADELDSAEQLRTRAESEAEARAREVDERRSEREQRAKQTEAAQERAAEQTRQKRRAAAEKKAKRERLEVLDDQAAALDREAEALTADDEAQRLR
ncbi:MAG: hypothetical protein QOJ71_3110, partial [Actinomycetota bacterium]|nr:hypothetical protein [Actinomycetota bacterium]